MFQTAPSLLKAGDAQGDQRLESGRAASLDALQAHHGAAQRSFEEALAAQMRVDEDNIQLVADGIDQLARMLVTEADRQRAEIGPVYEQYAGIAEETRTGLRARAEELRARLSEASRVSDAGVRALEGLVREQTARRKAAFRAMRQEFQRSMDDVASQFRVEREERER